MWNLKKSNSKPEGRAVVTRGRGRENQDRLVKGYKLSVTR